LASLPYLIRVGSQKPIQEPEEAGLGWTPLTPDTYVLPLAYARGSDKTLPVPYSLDSDLSVYSVVSVFSEFSEELSCLGVIPPITLAEEEECGSARQGGKVRPIRSMFLRDKATILLILFVGRSGGNGFFAKQSQTSTSRPFSQMVYGSLWEPRRGD